MLVGEDNTGSIKKLQSELDRLINSVRNYYKDKNPVAYLRAEAAALVSSNSLEEFMANDLSLSVFCFLIVALYVFMVSSVVWLLSGDRVFISPSISHRNFTSDRPDGPVFDADFLRNVDESLIKLLDLRSSGDTKAFENMLQSAASDYCVKQLGTYYFDDSFARESFDLNLEEKLIFVARGNKLTTHKSLAVTPLGTIVDPFDVDSNDKGSESCPLIDALFQRGTAGECQATSGGRDSGCEIKSNRRFNFRFITDFLEPATHYLSAPDSYPDSFCARILEDFKRETVRTLLLNWAALVEAVGSQEFESPEGMSQDEWERFVPDRESADFKKYIVSRDGGIYRTENYDEIDDGFLWCEGIEYFLNQKFILEEGYTYSAIRRGIDETFDQWYDDLLETMQIREP